MLMAAIAAPKISFETFAMTSSPRVSKHRKLHHTFLIAELIACEARRIAVNIAKLPELVRICVELSRTVLPCPSAIYPSERLLLSARSSL